MLSLVFNAKNMSEFVYVGAAKSKIATIHKINGIISYLQIVPLYLMPFCVNVSTNSLRNIFYSCENTASTL